MELRVKALLAIVLLITSATSAWSIGTDGITVNVEAMIGEATLVQERADGKKDTIVIPTGQTTQKDPTTGQTLLIPATEPNRVNEVVHAIAASSPDASDRLPMDEGCSRGEAPQRLVPRPEYDDAIAAAIAKEMEEMSPGELMMVIAVLINNANHLCIDASTVANTIALIATLRPEEAANVVFVASLLDPENADRYAVAVPPTHGNSPQANPASPITPERDIPPGGSIGEPPSPE